jgi:hypothetical protein
LFVILHDFHYSLDGCITLFIHFVRLLEGAALPDDDPVSSCWLPKTRQLLARISGASQSIPYIRASSIATANATDSSLCQHYEFVQQPAYKYNIYISFLANGNIIQRYTNMYIKFAAETNSKLSAHLPQDITARPSDSSNPHRCST